MIQFQHVTFSYPDQTVFEDLSFVLKDFSIAAVLGLNGEGKTTLIKLLLGLLRPDKGKILADGIDVRELDERKRSFLFSYVPQQTDDSLKMSVADFLCMARINQRPFFAGPRETDKKEALLLLKQMESEELFHKDLSSLSSGQRRLIYLARAIFQDSRILVMDEPVSSLDLLRQHDFLTFLSRQIQTEGRRLILSVHDPCLAYEYADSFLFFQDGTLRDIVKKEETGLLIEDIEALYQNKVKVFLREGKLYIDHKT